MGATTNIDLEGERLSKSDLEQLASQRKNTLSPIFNQHDHALPPVGRCKSHEVRDMGNGHWGLYGIWEVWEPGDEHPGPDPEGRKIAIRDYSVGETVVAVDASFERTDTLDDLAAIEKLGFSIYRERRKAFDPGSVLLVALGVIAGGFLKEIGKDIYVGLKERIKSLRAKNTNLAKRVLLTMTIHDGSRKVEVDVIVDEPTTEALDRLYERGFAQIDRALTAIFEDKRIVRAAFRGDQEGFPLLYTVDEDGFPSELVAVDWEKIGGVSISYSKGGTRRIP